MGVLLDVLKLLKGEERIPDQLKQDLQLVVGETAFVAIHVSGDGAVDAPLARDRQVRVAHHTGGTDE